MRSVTVEAFAKINLTLEVFGKRSDGFHDVRTILHTIDLSDRVSCRARRGPFGLSCRADGVPEDETNTIWRAAAALWRAHGRSGAPCDVAIEVTKRIPARAGLGGGSSDAAATLLALARLWNVDLTNRDLVALASTIGADVPFFLAGGAALGIGRGDEIYPLADLPRWSAVIALPPFGVSTVEAYAWKDAEVEPAAPVTRSDPGVVSTWLGRLPGLRNDLEPVVARRHPEIAGAIAALRRQGALLAAMSGSGSAVFGLFPTSRLAKRARKGLPFGAGWRVHVVSLLPRAAFERHAHPEAARR